MRENDLSDGGRLHRVGDCSVLGGLEDGAVRFTAERDTFASDLDRNGTPRSGLCRTHLYEQRRA